MSRRQNLSFPISPSLEMQILNYRSKVIPSIRSSQIDPLAATIQSIKVLCKITRLTEAQVIMSNAMIIPFYAKEEENEAKKCNT